MTRTEASEAQITSEEGEVPSGYPLLERLVNYVTTDNPTFLKNELFTKASESSAIDAEGLKLLEDAVKFMEEAHEGQLRKYSYQNPEIQKPFITHTLSTALMVFELMGEEVTADELTVALLHDVIEDGKITEEGKERNVRKSDLIKRGFRKEIVEAVDSLSNVHDIEFPGGGAARRKLSDHEYALKVDSGNQKYPKLHIATIKACDRSTNAIDPFRAVRPPLTEQGVVYQSSNAFTSRQNHIINSETYLFPMVAHNQLVSGYLRDVIDLAKLTCTEGFNPHGWQRQLKDFQFRPKQ